MKRPKKSDTVDILVPADRVAFIEKLSGLPEDAWKPVAAIARSMEARQRLEAIFSALSERPAQLERWLQYGEKLAGIASSRKAVRS